MADEPIDELLGRSLVHVLDKDGHGLYLRHPATNEVVLVAFSTERKVTNESMRKLRRIVAGIVYEAIAEARSEPCRRA